MTASKTKTNPMNKKQSLFKDEKKNEEAMFVEKSDVKLKPSSSNRPRPRSHPNPLKPRQDLAELLSPVSIPKSPCFIHQSLPTPFSEIIDRCDKELTEYSNLAETAVSVRELSKKLGQARIKSDMKTIMIVTKPNDLSLIKWTRKISMYLITTPRFGKDHGVTVYVEDLLKDNQKFDYKGMLEESPLTKGHLKFWTKESCAKHPEIFNLVLTLGGDGTVLYTSWLFQKIVPPVIPFHMGSLGFLTNFDIKNHKKHLTNAMEEGIKVNLRMRFTCTVYRRVMNPDSNIKAKRCAETGEIMMKHFIDGGGSWETLECTSHKDVEDRCTQDKDLPCLVTQPDESFEVLNDLVVDRGAGPYMSLLELFGDNHHLTTVQADGLVVATPTGSTAYSMSAGGSLVHPAIPTLMITPICPHTLSFRPMLLPDSMELRICVPYNSRSTAWASFDGRGRIELRQGDHIKITPSKFPLPTVCYDSQSQDWFNSISRCLRWNERERQKSFVVVEEEISDSEDEYNDSNEDDDTSTKIDESSEQELTEPRDDRLLKTNGESVDNVDEDVNYNNNNNNNSNIYSHHRHPSNKSHHERAFAYVGKDGSDSSSNNSNSGGEGEGEEEWKVVSRKHRRRR